MAADTRPAMNEVVLESPDQFIDLPHDLGRQCLIVLIGQHLQFKQTLALSPLHDSDTQ